MRIHYLGALPGDWGYNIASQLSWLNVAYEVVHEAIMLPMFFLLGKYLHERVRFENAASNGLLLCAVLYAALSVITWTTAEPLIRFMAQKPDLVDRTVSYIKLEGAALFLLAIVRYLQLLLISLKKEKALLIVLAVQMILTALLDTFLLSSLPFSMNIGVNGIAVSNIITYSTLIFILFYMLKSKGIRFFSKSFHLDIAWLKDWLKTGGLSGLESFVRNAAFIIMIIRLINVVQEQGTFWIMNSIIWGWLLIPVLALGELIKRDCSESPSAVR